MVRLCHMAEGFNMKCEIHHGGNSLNNVANLHITMAVPNCEFFEFFPCTGANMYGLVEDIDMTGGVVHAPNQPGLGYQIDWDLVKREYTATAEQVVRRSRRICQSPTDAILRDTPVLIPVIPDLTAVIPDLTAVIPDLTAVIPALTTVTTAPTTDVASPTTAIPALTTAIPALTTVIPALTTVIPALTTVIPAKAGIHSPPP